MMTSSKHCQSTFGLTGLLLVLLLASVDSFTVPGASTRHAVRLSPSFASTSTFFADEAPADESSTNETTTEQSSEWVGGYIQDNPQLKIPQTKANLESMGPLQGNLDNIDKLDRMQKVHWPEFSWLNDKGKPASRLFRKFYDNISRIGYTKEGRVYSIICPQMGTAPLPGLGVLNVEVHVTGTRGWVDEDTHTMCAELEVEGHVW